MTRRNIVNNVMLTLTGVCTVVTSSVLFLILGFLVYNGWRSLNWDFFTKLPLSAGEMGGGLANAIVGSAVLILIAALIGIPVGFLGGIYLAEFGGKTVADAGPLHRGSAQRRAVHRHRNLCLDRRRRAHASFFGLGRRLRLEPDDDPHRSARHRAVSAGVPNSLREGSLALGASKTRTIICGDRTRGQTRHPHGHDPGRGAHRRRDRAAAVHEFQQPILGQRLSASPPLRCLS